MYDTEGKNYYAFLVNTMTFFNRRLKIIFISSITLFMVISFLYSITSKREIKFLITLVDYQWNPIVNTSVQFEIQENYYQRKKTNSQGQVIIYLDKKFDRNDYMYIIINDYREKILVIHEHVTVRFNMINQNTSELYDDEIFNET